MRRILTAALIVAIAATAMLRPMRDASRAAATGPDTWTPVANTPASPGLGPAALRLMDGSVLVGGDAGGSFGPATLERFWPSGQTWGAPLAGAALLNQLYYIDTMTQLPFGAGAVLITGPTPDMQTSLALLYDPVTFTLTYGARLNHVRFGATATLLATGGILVIGGDGGGADPASSLTAEIYSQLANTWTPAAPLPHRLFRHAAARLGNGKVITSASFDEYGNAFPPLLYDPPPANTWTPAGTSFIRLRGTATTLPDGRALFVGGTSFFSAGSDHFAPAELFDPVTNTWSPAGDMAVRSEGHTAALLDDGLVLVAGGNAPGLGLTTRATLYNPSTDAWSTVASMNTARYTAAAALLQDGRVLVAGGYNNNTAEIYEPGAIPPADTPSPTPTETGTPTATLTPTPCAGPCPTPTNSPTGTATFAVSAVVGVGGISEPPDALALSPTRSARDDTPYIVAAAAAACAAALAVAAIRRKRRT